jgi:hypothetical protein
MKMNARNSLLASIRWAIIALAALPSGCVLGYGKCLFMEPVKADLIGTVHFRSGAGGAGSVPVLVLERTAYIYAPALSKQCQSAHDVRLLPLADLPANIVENSKVEVAGSLALADSGAQQSRFAMNVATIRLIQ